jgi:hypothetical protein
VVLSNPPRHWVQRDRTTRGQHVARPLVLELAGKLLHPRGRWVEPPSPSINLEGLMRFFISTLTAGVFASAMTVLAQQQPPPSQPPQEPEKQPPQAAASTITGCVQEAKTTDGGTAYILNMAEGGTAKMYLLVGQSPTELASHVNHKVEVTGQVQEPSAPPAENGAAPKPNVVRPPLVQIESLKMVAETCK